MSPEKESQGIGASLQKALEFHKNGALEKAEKLYNAILEDENDNLLVLKNLGFLYKKRKKFRLAVLITQRAIKLFPKDAQLHNSLGTCYEESGDISLALVSYKNAIACNEKFLAPYNNIGVILYKKREYDKAIEIFKMALKVNSDDLQTMVNLGAAFNRAGSYDKAIEVLEKALELDPENINARVNLGNVYNKVNRHEEALSCHKKVLKKDPHAAINYSNIAISHKFLENYDESIKNFKKALSIEPEFVNAHFDFATTLLLTGKFIEGMQEYEWRLKKEEMLSLLKKYPYLTKKPEFKHGVKTENKTLLIYSEQGFGDNIQFIRYAKVLKEQYPMMQIKVATRKELVPLFEEQEFIDAVVDREKEVGAFDYQIAVMSLMRLYPSPVDSIPLSHGYLSADQKALPLKIVENKIKVGFVWSGSQTNENHLNRRLSLKAFEKIIKHKKVQSFSLQVGEDSKDIKKLCLQNDMMDLEEQLSDFYKTAAAILQLDLVITSDTSVAHLAGALNCPVWLCLQKIPDWRWMLDRTDSPWYRSARVFRQEKKGSWNEVYEKVFDTFIKEYDLHPESEK